MSWKNTVSVILNNDSIESFYTGDIVTGTIKFELLKDIEIESIDMEVIGISKAQWTRFSPTVPYLKIYSEKKKILYVKQNNILSENFRKDKSIPAGVYSYPFHFALPHDLPSTFKSSIASVNYLINIKSKPKCKIRTTVTLNVLANVNLNSWDDMLKPCEYEFQKSFRGSTKLFVNLKTYKSFAPRQIIPVEINLINENQVKIKKIQVTLVQKVRYTVTSGYADDEKDIIKVDYKNIASTLQEVCCFNMEIPQVVPSSITSSDSMIDVSYELRIEVFFPYHTSSRKYQYLWLQYQLFIMIFRLLHLGWVPT